MIKVKVKIRLREVLEERGMTQQELAERTGIRPAAISALSRAIVERINIDHLERIASELGITDINELVTFITFDSNDKKTLDN